MKQTTVWKWWLQTLKQARVYHCTKIITVSIFNKKHCTIGQKNIGTPILFLGDERYIGLKKSVSINAPRAWK